MDWHEACEGSGAPMEHPMRRPHHYLSLLALVTVVGAACTDAPNPLDIGARGRTSAALRSYESCEALGDDLRDHTRERARTMLLQQREQLRQGGGWWFGVDAGAPAAESDAANDGGTRQEGVDFSGTNNQEQGVDEADIVKTDGYFIYTLNGDRLEILGVPEFGQLTATSSTTIEGWPTQLLLSDDRAVVFSQIYAWEQDPASPLGALDTLGHVPDPFCLTGDKRMVEARWNGAVIARSDDTVVVDAGVVQTDALS